MAVQFNDCYCVFKDVWSQIKQTRVIFNHLKLWVAVAKHKIQVGENLNKKTYRKKGLL